MSKYLFTAMAIASLLFAPGAQAHVSLAASTPAAGASVGKVTQVQLRFSDVIAPASARAEVVMTAMPGMTDHPPMKMPLTSAIGKDGRSMTLTMKRALVPGTYQVKWTAAGSDGHKRTGAFDFKVK
ncbi:copper resistance protein CopC [Sphingopyxis sp. MWB1]|uniref:copper resistance protein CopC n=1 Tax=Sphingopyxis sp. MWB1 TaxID=1537715 RepID=UPI00051A640B|nr:copper resistance protein CopC [Sphingopyxis sp. MWB1]